LYSVVVPALNLTVIVDSIGAQVDPTVYDPRTHEQPILRIGASLLFINQIWNFTIIPLSNGPFWSLSYEFVYYLAFAAAIFAPGKWRYALTFVVLLIAGPRITLYFSIWLVGVLVYYLRPKLRLSPIAMGGVFFVSLALFFAFVIFGTPLDSVTSILKEQLDSEGYLTIFDAKFFIGGQGGAQFPSDLMIALAFAGTLLTCFQFTSIISRC
jgi:peptidoglycan/LPS O-acetylase OafA/YrhL